MAHLTKYARFVAALSLIFPASIRVAAQDANHSAGLPLSSNLPIVVIDTEGQSIPDEPKIMARMGIVDNGQGAVNRDSDPFNAYDGFIGIERRGASSQSFPKLSYAVETRTADQLDISVPLLGLPVEEDWVLHGPYSDKSLLRNLLIFEMARRMGRYASRTRLVELILNNDYQGVYVLMERIKRDINRVDIATLNPNEIIGDDLTGGYIVKIDKTAGSETEGWTSPHAPRPGLTQRVYYQYHYPKPSDIAPQQRAYIQDVVAAFEAVMASDQYADPVEGYARYIDVDSAVDFIILNEIARNVDGYRLSTFLHKDKDSVGGGKLIFGPVWDFNLGFGNADYYGGGLRQGFQIQTTIPDFDAFQPPFWWEKLWQEPAFNERLIERWQALRQEVLRTDSLLQFIDRQAALLEEAAARNFARWQILGTYVWPNAFIGTTYAEEINYLKGWLVDRIEWIDANLSTVVISREEELPFLVYRLSPIFPNPMQSEGQFSVAVGNAQHVHIDLYDMLGRQVGSVYDGRIEANQPQSLVLDARGLAGGVYLLRATGQTFSTTRRVAIR